QRVPPVWGGRPPFVNQRKSGSVLARDAGSSVVQLGGYCRCPAFCLINQRIFRANVTVLYQAFVFVESPEDNAETGFRSVASQDGYDPAALRAKSTLVRP